MSLPRCRRIEHVGLALALALAPAGLASRAHAQSAPVEPSDGAEATAAGPPTTGTEAPADDAPPTEAPAPAVPPGYGTELAAPADPAPEAIEPPEASAPARRGLPIRVAERPLTLTAGTMRFDHAVLIRGGGSAFGGGLVAMMAFQLGLGITDDVEVSLLWPIQRDPTLTGTWRVFTDGTLDVGLRAAVQAPIVTEGNTDARIGVPIVLRGGPVRFYAAAELDLLFTSNVSTLLAVPAQLAVSAGRAFTFGAQGWIGVLDGRHPVGDVQGFLTFTAWAGLRPVLDVRFAAGYAPGEADVIFNHSITVYPQLW